MTVGSPISYSSALNHPEHYADLDAFHVIRPALDAAQVQNLEKWARLVASNQERFEFFSDYSLPMYKHEIGGIDDAARPSSLVGGELLGKDGRKFASYCSEFVWSLLALRSCDSAAFDSSCVRLTFSTANGMMTGLVPQLSGDSGLAQGPEASLAGGGVAADERTKILTETAFVDVLTDEGRLAGRMSSRHIQVARVNRDAMKAVNGYYGAGEPGPVASAINQGLIGDVSPTSFMVR